MLAAMDNGLQQSLGVRIKTLRMDAGLSQESLALHIGMDHSYLASIEAGRRNVTLQNLKKIARGFGINLSELL